MASVLLVVGNVTLSTGDQLISDLCDGTEAASSRTDTVEARAHDDPPANFDAYDLIIVSETVSSGTFWTNYSDLGTEAKPVIVLENGNFDEFRLSLSPTSTTTTTAFLADGTHHIAGGETEGDNETFITAGEATQDVTADLGAGAEKVWAANSDELDWRIWAYDTAASMTSDTAPARRVAVGYKDAAVATFTTIAKNVFLACIEWALGEDAGGVSQIIGQAIDSSTAQAVAAAKTQAISQALETDTAQAVTRGGITVAIGQAVEADTAQALTWSKVLAISQAVETDTAQSVTPAKAYLIGLASELDTAQAVAAAKALQVGQAVESDTAQTLSALKVLAIGQASELDTAQPVSVAAGVVAVIGQAIESDLAQSVAVSKVQTIGIAAETDTAQTVAAVKAYIIGQATELDTAQAVSVAKAFLIGLATETDTALAVVSAGGLVVIHIPGDTAVELNPSTTYVAITPHLNQVLLDPSATFVSVDASESKA